MRHCTARHLDKQQSVGVWPAPAIQPWLPVACASHPTLAPCCMCQPSNALDARAAATLHRAAPRNATPQLLRCSYQTLRKMQHASSSCCVSASPASWERGSKHCARVAQFCCCWSSVRCLAAAVHHPSDDDGDDDGDNYGILCVAATATAMHPARPVTDASPRLPPPCHPPFIQ